MTGASGGVGSTAVALLHKLGYQVVAVSGRESTHEYLKSLGASRVLLVMSLPNPVLWKNKSGLGQLTPLATKCWQSAGANELRRLRGGLWSGGWFTLPTTVMPFILRNVRLQGVDSVMTPPERRAQAWQRLVADLPESFYTQAAKEISLSEAPNFAEAIINNQIQGRTLVKVN